MRKKLNNREIVLLEPESPSALKWLLVGAALGAGLALLLAPASGEETRRQLARRARKIRRAAEGAIDELQERFDAFRGTEDEDEDEGEESEEVEEVEEVDEAEEGEESEKGEKGERVEERAEPGAGRGDGDVGGRAGSLSSARAELERRLAAARARRRAPALEDEEPVA